MNESDFMNITNATHHDAEHRPSSDEHSDEADPHNPHSTHEDDSQHHTEAFGEKEIAMKSTNLTRVAGLLLAAFVALLFVDPPVQAFAYEPPRLNFSPVPENPNFAGAIPGEPLAPVAKAPRAIQPNTPEGFFAIPRPFSFKIVAAPSVLSPGLSTPSPEAPAPLIDPSPDAPKEPTLQASPKGVFNTPQLPRAPR